MLVDLTFIFLLCCLIWFSLISEFPHHTRAAQEAPLRTSVETEPFLVNSLLYRELLGMAVRLLNWVLWTVPSLQGKEKKKVFSYIPWIIKQPNSLPTRRPSSKPPHSPRYTQKNVGHFLETFSWDIDAVVFKSWKFQTLSLSLSHNSGQHACAKLLRSFLLMKELCNKLRIQIFPLWNHPTSKPFIPPSQNILHFSYKQVTQVGDFYICSVAWI